MSTATHLSFRPKNVVVRADSDAGRRYRAALDEAAGALAEAIAPGFVPDHALDLHNFGGKTIADLTFANFYLGGTAAWAASDRGNIDQALAAAMSDSGLNDIVGQYFTTPITSRLASSKVLDINPGAKVFQDTAHQLVQQVQRQGLLAGLDPATTLVNLMLPRGVALSDGNSNGTMRHHLDDEASDSHHGLAGYHGSCDIGGTRHYYAVGVYSATSGGVTNGIPVFADSWKNVVATFYHELNEARTDADVEVVNDTGNAHLLGWYNNKDGEIGDVPMDEAGEAGMNLDAIMKEVALAGGGGSVPVQLMYSNRVHGPEEPGGAGHKHHHAHP
jgi:hypothetical protein